MTYSSISRWLFAGLATFATSPSLSQACDRYPVAPGELVRQYTGPNDLLYQEYDTDKDAKADWGVAYQQLNGVPKQWPLFYAQGFDDDRYKDQTQVFTAVIVWQDKKGGGHCEDIVQVYVRRDDTKPLDMDKLEKGTL